MVNWPKRCTKKPTRFFNQRAEMPVFLFLDYIKHLIYFCHPIKINYSNGGMMRELRLEDRIDTRVGDVIFSKDRKCILGDESGLFCYSLSFPMRNLNDWCSCLIRKNGAYYCSMENN